MYKYLYINMVDFCKKRNHKYNILYYFTSSLYFVLVMNQKKENLNIREYIQFLINEHLPEEKRFSINNLSDEELLYFSDFLTWDLDYEDTLNTYQKQENEIKENCEHINAFTEFYLQQRIVKKEILGDLNSLNQDILLDQKI